jgi:hypothetical protein
MPDERTLLTDLTLIVFVGRLAVEWEVVLAVLRISADAAFVPDELMGGVSLRLGVFDSVLLDCLTIFLDRTAALSLFGFSFSVTSLDCLTHIRRLKSLLIVISCTTYNFGWSRRQFR